MIKPKPNPVISINRRIQVYANEITLLEADSNYTKIHFEEKAPLMVAITLKRIEILFKEHGFLRIHKKYLINLEYADMSLLENEMVTFQNNVEIRVSRRKKGTLRKSLIRKKNVERGIGSGLISGKPV